MATFLKCELSGKEQVQLLNEVRAMACSMQDFYNSGDLTSAMGTMRLMRSRVDTLREAGYDIELILPEMKVS